MKIKRFLAFAVALAMVLSIVPAMSLTASAAETVVYTATATGHSGSANGGSLFVACTGGAGDGSNTRAPFINGTTAGHNTTLGSTRIGVVEFQIDGSIDPNSVESAIMSLYLKSVNGNLGDSWTLIAGYETANPTLSYATGGMNDANFAAINNDYSNAATFWTNESCSNTTSGWKTMDIARAVKNALAANAALETPKDKVTVVIRLQVPTAGLNLGDSGAEVPYLTVTTNDPNLITVTDNLNAISLPLATKANIELPATVKGAADADIAVRWTSDNDEVLDGKGNYTSPEDITTVVLTPSAIVGSEVVYGKAHDVVVFPASRAGSVYDSGAGVFTIGTENIISANGTEASFEGDDRLAGWIAHTGQQTNSAVFWANSATNIVPDGEWAYVGQWNDPLTGSNYCTIDTMWPVNAGKYYLSFYAKKPAGGSTTYVYYSTDDAHHIAESQITSEAWVEKVSPTSDWVKYEYIIDAPQAGYIGFTSFNIGNNNSWGTQFDDFELYSAEMAATSVEVVATYTAGGEQVDTATLVYDTTKGEENVTFPELYYAPNGSNAIYYAPAETLAESATIEMTAVENNGNLEIGHVFANAGVQYEIMSANLIPNGDFSLGLTGWYNGAGTAMTQLAVNTDGTAKITGNGGSSSEAALQRSWKLEAGKTYLFTYTQDNANVGPEGSARWQRFSLNNNFSNNNDVMLLGAGAGDVETGQSVVLGENNLVFTNTDGFDYANFRAGYSSDVTVGHFGLYEVAPATVTVTEEIASVEDPAAVKVFGNDAVVLPATLNVTGTLGSNVEGTVAWEAPATYPAGKTTVNGTVTVKFSETAEAITEAVSVDVTVVDEFKLDDFASTPNLSGPDAQNKAKEIQKEFPVAIRGAFTMQFTANYASFGDLFITIKTKDAGFFGSEQIALGHDGNAGFRPVNGNGNGGRAADDYTHTTLATGVDYGFIVTTDASEDKYSVVVYDVATGVVVAEVKDFGYRTNADAIEAITTLTNNGKGEVALKNIKVDTSVVEFCTVTVDGEAKKVVKGHYGQALTGAALVDDEGNIYAPVNGFVTVPVDADMVLTTKALGLEMVNGAQVRIGATELEKGEKPNALADSGIRFLAKADYTDTLAADAEEIGIKIIAEASDAVAYVKADKFQNDDNTVFTAAITNLKESNYNRKYTAVAYAKLGEVEVTSAPVTRSIYQVSAGIMKNGTADAENAAYTVEGVVKNILNAYVNQTGIRLSYDATTGITVEDGKYTGDVFFTVESVSDGDDGWNVTITPDTTWGTPAEIAEWWTDYVRFNNNNSVAKGYISANYYIDSDPVFVHEDGTLTFNFDTTDDGTGPFDGPSVPIG